MTTPRTAIALLAAALGTVSAAGQGKLTVVNDSSKELKRSAHRLHIPVERLRNARSALRETTDLALRLDPAPHEGFANVANLWRQLDRKAAPTIFDDLFRELCNAAAGATEDAVYDRATNAARMMLSSLTDGDVDKLDALIAAWPERPATRGAASPKPGPSMLEGLRLRAVHQYAYSDPDRALKLVETGGVGYSAHAAVVHGLLSKGRREDAELLIDRAKADFARKTPSAS